jgi:hypothetical protein
MERHKGRYKLYERKRRPANAWIHATSTHGRMHSPRFDHEWFTESFVGNVPVHTSRSHRSLVIRVRGGEDGRCTSCCRGVLLYQPECRIFVARGRGHCLHFPTRGRAKNVRRCVEVADSVYHVNEDEECFVRCAGRVVHQRNFACSASRKLKKNIFRLLLFSYFLLSQLFPFTLPLY